MFQLFPDEQIVSASDDNSVILTTHRISREVSTMFSSQKKSIMLEHITSIENKFNSNYSLLALGILACLAGFGILSEGSHDAPVLGIPILLLGVYLTYRFFRTRQNIVIIASPSTRIYVPISGSNNSVANTFVNKVEETKHQRISKLNK